MKERSGLLWDVHVVQVCGGGPCGFLDVLQSPNQSLLGDRLELGSLEAVLCKESAAICCISMPLRNQDM